MAILVPELFADAVNASLDKALIIASRIATDCTEVVPEIRNCGQEVNFPTFNRLSGAETMTVGAELTPERVQMTENKAVVKQMGKSVAIYDAEELSVKGNVYDNYSVQIAQVLAEKLDTDLLGAIDAEAVFKQPTASATEITSDEIQGGLALFGDQRNASNIAGIIVNSRLIPSLVKMEAFVDANKTYNQAGNGVVENNVVGWYYNIPVLLTDVGTYDDTSKECKTYIVKKSALGYLLKRDMNIESQRNVLKKCWFVAADMMYSAKLLSTKGAVILRKTVA